MGDTMQALERNGEKIIARVRLSDTFQRLTGRWVPKPCILQQFQDDDRNIGIVRIPGETRPVLINRADFEIVS